MKQKKSKISQDSILQDIAMYSKRFDCYYNDFQEIDNSARKSKLQTIACVVASTILYSLDTLDFIEELSILLLVFLLGSVFSACCFFQIKEEKQKYASSARLCFNKLEELIYKIDNQELANKVKEEYYYGLLKKREYLS